MVFKILVAEDEEITLKHLLSTLKNEGYEASGFSDGLKAFERIEEDTFDLLIADIKMPGLTGLELLEKIKEKNIETEVIIITGYGSIDSAVAAIKKGAYDYITKPFDLDELLLKVRKIYEEKEMKKEIVALKTSLGAGKGISGIARSDSMKKIFEIVDSIKDSDCDVLLTGESGVGKSLIARLIHSNSRRREKPFLSINCATFTENLLASELFGHEKGAFTGAIGTKQGLLEIADTGTVFLDEISEISTSLQAKLLHVIEDSEFFRVGGTRSIRVDVRFIAATNRNIHSLISDGKFREDLYYRLNVMEINIPPLRERKDDIEALSKYFLQKLLPKAGKKITGFTKEALEVLKNYSYPGNVRELENIIERAIILEKGSLISPASLPQGLQLFHIEALLPDRVKSIDELNKEYAEKVVEMSGGNKSKAAEMLGISRTSLWRILKEE
ncbi:MAG TPA: sigma-54 dependent transcriptional regulator [Thermodesulfovibrionales bacterium]|nr:sigma-54 dependent transcriptional regulator [Thermodesulfovibrionales bacterium]